MSQSCAKRSTRKVDAPPRPTLRLLRGGALPSLEVIKAVMSHRGIYELGALIPDRSITGRPPAHPGYLLIAFGMLARHYRSGARAHAELSQPEVWNHLVRQAILARQEIGEELWRQPGLEAVSWSAWRYARDTYLANDHAIAEMAEIFTPLALLDARSIGLLHPNGPGSWAHPDRSRIIYGDGTVIRPIYRPPVAVRVDAQMKDSDADADGKVLRYPDLATGELLGKPPRRYDPDGLLHHGHAGPVHGTNLVSFYARGDLPNQRIILGLDTVRSPGQEASTAVGLGLRIAGLVGDGAMAFVYDGALRGVHIETLMSQAGMLVINKVHASATGVLTASGKKVRTQLLDIFVHDGIKGPCRHQIGLLDGAVIELVVNDRGEVLPGQVLERVQVKRSHRGTGLFHFNVAYQVSCPGDPSGGFLIWISPHSTKEGNHSRPDQMRVIPEVDTDFAGLYGLRPDSESANALLKRGLICDRSPSLGRKRLMVDMTCFSLLHNAITRHRFLNNM